MNVTVQYSLILYRTVTKRNEWQDTPEGDVIAAMCPAFSLADEPNTWKEMVTRTYFLCYKTTV